MASAPQNRAKLDSNWKPSLIAISDVDFSTPVTLVADPVTGALDIKGTLTIAANSSINVNQWGGTGTTLGQKAMASSVPVVIASDQSGVPVTGTFWQATQPVSGTVTANAGTGTFNIQANASVNVAQINGVTPLMGNGTTGTGSQRVTIASDNTAFAVNATLSAETTKVIGTVRVVGNVGGVFDAATQAAVPANALYLAGINGSGNLTGIAVQQGFGDAVNPGNSSSALLSNGYVYNGSTWDRLRGTTNGTYTLIRDAAGNARGANVTAANELTVLPTQKDTFAAATTFTITLASLANSTAGVGRQSTLVTSNTAKSALIAVKFTVGTSPTANTLIYVYLLRGDGTLTDDNAGSTDAGLTVINAPLLGTILCSAATSNATYYGLFDTKFLGSLGSTFGIAIVNSTGATANATAGNFSAEYTLIT